MSTSNVSAIVAEAVIIRRISTLFVQLWCYAIFFFGITGHSLSIYVFTRRSLRSNPCSRYLLASTFGGLVVILLNIPLRYFQAVHNLNVFLVADKACKIFTWLLVWGRALNPWFLVLASIDRFLCSSSSPNTRAWSNLRVASHAIPSVTLLIGLAYAHIIYYAEIGVPLQRCDARPGPYLTFYGIFNLMLFGAGPSICMLIFGLLTVRHVRQTQRRNASHATSTVTQNQSQAAQRQKATDWQWIRMMFVQCIFFSVTAAPSAVNYIYTSIVPNMQLDALQIAKTGLAANITNYLSITGPSLSFYLFTLSSQLFRKELMRLFRRRARVAPALQRD